MTRFVVNKIKKKVPKNWFFWKFSSYSHLTTCNLIYINILVLSWIIPWIIVLIISATVQSITFEFKWNGLIKGIVITRYFGYVQPHLTSLQKCASVIYHASFSISKVVQLKIGIWCNWIILKNILANKNFYILYPCMKYNHIYNIFLGINIDLLTLILLKMLQHALQLNVIEYSHLIF